jgi:ribonuclease T
MTSSLPPPRLADRFRGFLPVVVDVETGGFDPERDALLELAAVIIHMDESGRVYPGETVHAHVEPFPGAGLDPKSLAITRIDPTHPFRMALAERAALDHVFGRSGARCATTTASAPSWSATTPASTST